MPIPANWQPQWDENYTKQQINKYKDFEHLLRPEQQEQIQQHAEAYGIPYYTGDFSLLQAIGQAGAGFVEGFTTLNIAEHPDNEYEQIFRNLGHLAGFVPGIMSKPAAMLGARGFAAAAANLKSIPMRGADFLTKHAKTSVKTLGKSFVGRSQAVDTAKNFLMGNKARHIVEGAFKLGAASAISSWQGGVDQMIESGMGGAVAGGVFRTIGNLTPGTSTHEKVGKALAGSLFMGLPSTMRGDTTPEQIYEYTMGAYFGGNEVSWTRAKAHKFMKTMGEKAQKDPEWAGMSGMDPELMPKYDKLPEEVKPILKEEATKAWGDPDANKEGWMAMKLLQELGIEGKVTEEQLIEKGFEPTGEYRDGEQIYKADPKMVREKFKTYVTSGGAKGADTEFAKQADRMGIPTINYTFGGHAKGIRATGFQRVLSTTELEEADSHIREANKNIGKKVPNKEFSRNLQRRNWYQIKYADAVYAIGEFERPQIRETGEGEQLFIKGQTQVKGGTGLSVQMAIDNGKPVFFFNQAEGVWYKWNQGANKGLGMFTHIKEPPAPPRRFAGIGTRNINEAGRQAIKTLFEDNWKPVSTATEKVATNAKEKAKKAKIAKLGKEIAETEKLGFELKDDIIAKEAQGVDTFEAESKLAEVIAKNQDLVERRNRLTAPPLKGVTPEAINKETISSEISDKADTDFEGPTELEVGKRSLQFTKKHLNKLFAGAPTVLDQQNKKRELSNIVETVLQRTDEGGNPLYLRRGSKENLSEEWADALQQELRDVTGDSKFELKEEGRRELRQWMTRKNMGKLVTHLQSDGNTVFEMSNPSNPISRAGNRKHQEEPIKRIEVAYREKGGADTEPTYMVLDHITIKTEKGNRDLDLSDFRNNHLLRENNWDERVASKAYDSFVSNAMKKMAKKGYYAFGGSSDKDKIIWVKYNPEVANISAAEATKKINAINKSIKGKHQKFNIQLNRSRKEFIQKYKGSSKDFDRMWLSNLYYDLHMNGMEATDANIKTLLTHPGFIKDSAAFNKRQQIWMNNAWEGDVEFIKKQLTKEVVIPGKILKESSEIEQEYQDYIRTSNYSPNAKRDIVRIDHFKKYNNQGQLIGDRFDDAKARVEFANARYQGKRVYDDVSGNFLDILDAPTKKTISSLTDVINKDTGEVQENYNYLLVRDLSEAIEKASKKDKQFFHDVSRLNSELPENVDGAIIVSDKVLNAINADFGNPASGQNKSFIVSPNAKDGALLGKYMMHAAGEKMSKLMEAEGLHMIMQETAIKQRGLRELSDYDIVNGKLVYDKASVLSDLSPEHVRGNFGVYGNEHMVGKQRIPKQLLQNLLPTTWKEVSSEVIDNMFEGIIRQRWDGNADVNKRVDAYLKMAKDGNLKPEDLVKIETELINNIDKIGIEKLVEAMKNEYAPGLSEAIYNKVLKVEKNSSMQRFLEGDITEEQFNEEQQEIVEFNSIADRVINSANEWVEGQRAEGVDANISSVYMHKFIRDFRIKAVQNFLLNEATKPVRDNSASAFMRPYDKAMRLNLDDVNPRLKELETNDEIFFLDNAFKNTNIKVALTGKHKNITSIKLGDLWKLYNAKGTSTANKEYIEDVFEAVTVRTPMDSMSGAQVLKFAGFTGREGHGILMHGRAMRAEGGADLDGDKSSVFFGGEGGFSKSWKKAYKDNKKEFYRTDKKGVEKVSDNKGAKIPGTDKSYRDILALSPDSNRREYLISKASQYSPTERIRISEAAVNGRNQLGPAVVNKQVMAAAYSAILANGGKDVFYVKGGKGKKRATYKISITARNKKTDREHQRNMGRAQIGLASDPLDELGLKGNKLWFKEMWKAHFDITAVEELRGKGKKPKQLDIVEADKVFHGDILESGAIRGGILGNMTKINKAYWGRNWVAGRKFNMNEILDLGGAISDIPLKSQQTSFLSRIGKLLHGLDWSDSIFGKINQDALLKVYDDHAARVGQYDWLKKFLGRPSFRVDKNPYIINTMKHQLWTNQGLNSIAASKSRFLEAIKGTMYSNWVKENPEKYFGKSGKSLNLGGPREKMARRDLLMELKDIAEDFVVNDMTDLASISNISRIADVLKKTDDIIFTDNVNKEATIEQAINRIHNEVDRLKINSYLMSNDRKNIERHLEQVRNLSDPESLKAVQELVEFMNKTMGIKPASKKTVRSMGDEPTAEMDQNTIDTSINLFKSKLTPGGQALFDQLMLGSINRGNMEAINKFEAGMGKPNRFTMEVLKGLRKEASRTRVSRLGFNSNAVSDRAITEHIAAFANNFKEGYRPPSENQFKRIDQEIENYKSRIEDDGLDPALIEALLPSGYGGIKEGKLDAESKQIVAEIADIVKEMHNKDSQDINGLMRGVVGKDLNAMNKRDFVVFRNWLTDIRRGNLIQRMFHKPGPVQLNKRHWALFPRAVNAELMRDDIVMMKEKGFFTDKTGAVREGIITKPTHYIDIVQNFIGKMNDSAVNISDKYIKRFNQSMLFHSGLEDSQKLWEVAIRQREAHWTETDRIRTSDKDPEVKKRALDEIYSRLHDAEKANNWKDLADKKYTVTVDGERVTISGKDVVSRINKELTSLFVEMKEFIKGREGALEQYRLQTPRGGVKYDYQKFVRHLQEHVSGRTPKGWIKEGISDIPSYFGIDGLRKIARSMQIDMISDKKMRQEIANQEVGDTGELPPDSYFPHMFFDKSVSKRLIKDSIKRVLERPESEMTEEQKKLEIKKLYYKNKSLGGEMRFEEMEDWDLVDSVLEDIAQGKKISEDRIKWFNSNERAGSMKSRDVHMGGWSIDPVVVESYIRSMSNTYHRQLNQMFGREQVQNMYGQMIGKWGKEQTVAWQNFMKLYIQDAIGNPSIIPQYMYEDPKMKIKGTPYAWWSDNKVRDRINKFGKAIGLGDKALPENLRGIDTETLRAWSNLEAQYQMASLLAHPKSAVANVFGGTTHTIMSAGWGNFVKAKNYNYLSKINPKWSNKQAVNDFVISQGVLPEYLVYEMGLQKEFQNTKGKDFITELSAKLTRDPEMSEKTIGEIADRYGIKDRVMNFAAKFMTIPERALRRDAFMAHYVHAWDKFGGAIKEYDHPYLIQMAKKGVRATQFLYNAPFRPAFARTSLGKIMSRFQLWSWNSVRFRNDVRRQARIYDFTPGTEEWKRFERTMQTDLFTFALANVFAYSLFENNLPQPWGWIQDYSDWIFGDEGERDRAFYGAWPKAVAPLQMVTPPGLRMVGPTFSAILSDDWSRVGEYYGYTMLPFGRILRDVSPYSKGNLIENPMRLPEKIFGLPMMQLQRNITKWKNEEEAYDAIR